MCVCVCVYSEQQEAFLGVKSHILSGGFRVSRGTSFGGLGPWPVWSVPPPSVASGCEAKNESLTG